MISGRVTGARQALAQLSIRDGNGAWQTMPFVLDTGFTGYLALPERYSRQLGLTFSRVTTVSSATEQSISAPFDHARIIWFGRQRTVRVVQAGTHPLLGMSLLWNNHIAIDAVANGAVAITPLGG